MQRERGEIQTHTRKMIQTEKKDRERKGRNASTHKIHTKTKKKKKSDIQKMYIHKDKKRDTNTHIQDINRERKKDIHTQKKMHKQNTQDTLTKRRGKKKQREREKLKTRNITSLFNHVMTIAGSTFVNLKEFNYLPAVCELSVTTENICCKMSVK